MNPFDPVQGASIGERYVLDREVAVKFLHAAADEGMEARTRFALEAQLAAQLTSAYAVTVYDYGQVEGTPYLVMGPVRTATVTRTVAPAVVTTRPTTPSPSTTR